MSILSWFKNDDVMNKKDGHLANVGKWVGNLKFTAEEMAEMDTEMASAVREFAVKTLSENTERSKSRRDIANLTIKFYFILVFMTAIVYPFNPEWAQFLFGMLGMTGLSGGFISVMVFFFGSHWHRSVKELKSNG